MPDPPSLSGPRIEDDAIPQFIKPAMPRAGFQAPGDVNPLGHQTESSKGEMSRNVKASVPIG